MKATITSKGQITIPVSIRERLGLAEGQVLDFDETAPYLKAVPVFDEAEMRSVLGCAKGRLGRSSRDWVEATRGAVDPDGPQAMKTAVDSSVLLAVLGGEPGGDRWMEILLEARRAGRLVIGEVVYAEISPLFETGAELDRMLGRLGVVLEPTSAAAAFLAGTTFRRYRAAGGPRENLIPDFLVAAHARVQADRLAAEDRGYLRKYFADLPLLRA